MDRIEWDWPRASYYAACVESARAGRAAWELDVTACMFKGAAVLSPRLTRMLQRLPEPARVDNADVTRSVGRCVDHVLTRFAGVHRSTMLVDVGSLSVSDNCGAAVVAEITMIWHDGYPTLFTRPEVRLDEDFYTEKILLLTELRHMCQDE